MKSMKPSLPSVLAKYDTPNKEHVKKPKKKKHTIFYDTTEDEQEKLKESNAERHLQVLEDIRILRRYFYLEYRDLLTEKVEQQRHEFKSYQQKLDKEAKKKEELEHTANHRVKKRFERHILSHDEEFMQYVPKSDVYMIIGLQDKLIKEGKLKSRFDFDNFWLEMKKPEVFQSHFPAKGKNKSEEGSDGGMSSISFGNTVVPVPPKSRVSVQEARTLSNISESKESSRPTTQGDSWAITQQFKHVHSNEPSSAPLLKQVSIDVEKKFPKLELPALHCFTMDLGKKPPDPDEVKQKVELRAKEKSRRRFTKKLHKMYQLAMANGAAATSDLKRLGILDKHADLLFLQEGPDLTDIISDYYWADIAGSRTFPPSELPPIREQSDSVHQRQSSSTGSKKTTSAKSIRSAMKDAEPGKECVLYVPSPPLPLKLHDITDNSKIMEAKCLSSFWTNYAALDSVSAT